MKEKRQRRNVVIALPLYNQNGRNQLNGILDYIQKTRAWSPILVYSREELDSIIENADPRVTAGFILGGLAEGHYVEEALRTGIPCLLMDKDDSLTVGARSKFIHMKYDNSMLARYAAEHFYSLGDFRSFGYVRFTFPRSWCSEREQSFCRTLAKKGRAVSVFRCPTSSMDTKLRLIRWVDSLPKPAAVLAACDQIAVHVLNACKNAGIKVPDQLSLLGIDDDIFYCESTTPALSSIKIWSKEFGRAAAKEMTNLIFNRKSTTRCLTVKGKPIITVRESTKQTSPSTSVIRRAIAFIDKNAITGIDAADVARHLGISRRLMDMRFRQILDTTVLDSIIACKLKEAKRLLRKSDRPMYEIAIAAGFSSYNRLAKTFHDHVGMTLSEYRNKLNGQN